MNTKKMIAVMAVLAMAVAAFAVIPAGEISGDDSKIVELKGDFTSQLTLTSEQTVVVVDDLNIIDGGYLEILGDFTVKEGKTVTIEGAKADGSANSQLILKGDATIDGTIISKTGDKTDATKAGLIIKPEANNEVVINGMVSAIGNTSGNNVKSVKMDATNGKITVNGSVAVGTNAEVEFTKVVFEKNAALTVLGTAKGTISVYGTVNFDGKTDGLFAIILAEASAIINIVSVEGTISITDSQMFAYAYGGEQYYVQYSGSEPLKKKAVAEITESGNNTLVAVNTINFTDVENVKVTETVTTSIEYDEKTSQNMMVAATAMIFAPLDSAKAVEGGVATSAIATYGTTIYFETMTLNDVLVTFFGYNAIIKGDVTYPLQDKSISAGYKISNVCMDALEIPGSLAILKATGYTLHPLEGTDVEAAYYSVKDADNNVNFYYTTAQKAIDNGATDITMMGKLIVEKDLTVPAPVKLKTATIAIYAVEVKEGATFTIANGAQYDLQGNMKVEGTFVVENIDYGIKFNSKNIYADVQLTDGSYQMYTDVYNAFAKAKAGDEINAYKPVADTVIIDKDLTLPAGVAFYNTTTDSTPVAKTIVVNNGATFTVAGALYISATTCLVSETGKNPWNSKTPAVDSATGAVKDYSVIVIGANGVIGFDNSGASLTTDGIYGVYKIAGAYFLNDTTVAKDKKLYIANIPLAFSGIMDAKDNNVDIFGEVEIDNQTVSGTEKERMTVSIYPGSTVTMKNFTFAYGTVQAITGNFDTKATIKGDVGTSTGRIVFEKAATDSLTLEDRFIDGSMNLVINGSVESSKPASISGIVYFETFYYNLISVDGMDGIVDCTFTIPAGTAAFVIGNTTFTGNYLRVQLLIAGELKVTNKGVLYSDCASVPGTLTVEKLDGKSGSFEVVYSLDVGVSWDDYGDFDEDYIYGSALVTGSGKFIIHPSSLVVAVSNGSSVTADVLKYWMDNTAVSTEFYIDGVLWNTVYAESSNNEWFITDFVPSHSDYKIYGWHTYDEKTKTYADVSDSIKVGTIGYEKVYADLAKEIYNIVITADVGIDNVYIDGVIMTKIAVNNTFEMDVAAGTHTISYELANGYSGNAVITTVDGAKLVGGGLSFTVNDDKYDSVKDKMDITLSGIQKSGYDVDPETHEEKSTGLTVTEILLIVVVIIMAIMAVVLILRLNRS